MVEHHFREGRSHMPAPEVVIGALSQITSRIRLGFGVVLMPHAFTHPVRVAEKVATADLLSHGRVEWGTGRSTPMEAEVFGLDRTKSRASFEEAVRNVAAMWREEYYSCESEFLAMPERMVTPRPYQVPHPPPWMAAVSEGSAELAGRYGMGMLGMSIRKPIDAVARQIESYRRGLSQAEPLTDVLNTRAGIFTLVHCVDSLSDAEADYDPWGAAWWWYQSAAEFFLKWEFAHLSEAEQEKLFPDMKEKAEGRFDPKQFADDDMIIIGEPEQCLEKILRYEAAGADHLVCYVQFGSMPHEATLRNIELLGTEIIPQLERREIAARASVVGTAQR